MTKERLDEQTIAMRAAREFQDGMVVNLGMGIPMLCNALVPEGRDILFHSENGVLGFGATIDNPDEADIDLLNAQGQPVRPKPVSISSAISRAPHSLAIACTALKNPGGGITFPAVPWIGSTMIAAISPWVWYWITWRRNSAQAMPQSG